MDQEILQGSAMALKVHLWDMWQTKHMHIQTSAYSLFVFVQWQWIITVTHNDYWVHMLLFCKENEIIGVFVFNNSSFYKTNFGCIIDIKINHDWKLYFTCIWTSKEMINKVLRCFTNTFQFKLQYIVHMSNVTKTINQTKI